MILSQLPTAPTEALRQPAPTLPSEAASGTGESGVGEPVITIDGFRMGGGGVRLARRKHYDAEPAAAAPPFLPSWRKPNKGELFHNERPRRIFPPNTGDFPHSICLSDMVSSCSDASLRTEHFLLPKKKFFLWKSVVAPVWGVSQPYSGRSPTVAGAPPSPSSYDTFPHSPLITYFPHYCPAPARPLTPPPQTSATTCTAAWRRT